MLHKITLYKKPKTKSMSSKIKLNFKHKFIFLGIFVVITLTVGLTAVTNSYVKAAILDSPLGILVKAEKTTIARYLLGDYKFNDESDYKSTSYIKNKFSYDTLSFTDGINFVKTDGVSVDSSFGVSAWIFPQGESDTYSVLKQVASSSNVDFEINIDNKTLELKLRDDSDLHVDLTCTLSSDCQIEKNEWNYFYINAERNESNELVIDFFINGEGSSRIYSFGSFNLTQTNNIKIGEGFIGKMDTVFITDKKLSNSQVDKIYKNPKREIPEIIPSSYFLGLWDFDEQSGIKAYDKSNYKKHGVLDFNFSGWFESKKKRGKIGSYGVELDGVDDFISIDTNKKMMDQTEGTISLGFSVNSFPNAAESSTILSLSNGKSNTDLKYINIGINEDGKVFYQVKSDILNDTNILITEPIEIAKWYSLIITNKTTGTDIYVNGKLQKYTGSNTDEHNWLDDIFYPAEDLFITLGAIKKEKQTNDYFSGAIQFLHYYDYEFNENLVNETYNSKKIKKLYKKYSSEVFEIDLEEDQDQFYFGDYSDTKAELNNILSRATTDKTNPRYYESEVASLEDVNDYITIPSNASLRDLEEASLAVLFKTNTLPSVGENAYLYRDQGVIELYLNDEGQIVCNAKEINITDGYYVDGNWHMAICVFDGPRDEQKLIIDKNHEVKIAPTSFNRLNNSTVQNYIGGSGSGDNNFIGEIDDVFLVAETLEGIDIIELWNSFDSIVSILNNPASTYIGHWSFGNLNDKSPNINNISASSFVGKENKSYKDQAWTSTNQKVLNFANIVHSSNLNFDGDDDYISIDTNQNISIFDIDSDDLSIEAWIKTDKTGHIVSKNLEVKGVRNFELFVNSSGNIDFTFGNNSLISNQDIRDNDWHHVVATYDFNTKIQKIYIDGAVSNSQVLDSSQKIENNKIPLLIGASLNTKTEAINYFSGKIANVKIYDITLNDIDVEEQYLTPSEIHRNHLLVNMPLNEGAGAFVYDNTVSRFVGVLNNFKSNNWFNKDHSLKFDNNLEKIDVIFEDSLLNTVSSDIYFSALIKPEYISNNKYSILKRKDTSDGFEMYLDSTTQDNYNITMKLDSTPISFNNIYLSPALWNHLVFKIDYLESKLLLYINGEYINDSPLSDFFTPYPDDLLTIGEGFYGSLSDVSIIVGSLDVEAEEELVKYASLEKTPFEKIKLYFPFDEGDGSVINDKSSNDITGEIIGNANWVKNKNILHNRLFKKDYSKALFLDFEKNNSIELGAVLDINTNIALEMVVASNHKDGENVSLIDYGFGDSANSGAKFGIEVTSRDSVLIKISDGNTNENNVETFETARNTIETGKFYKILFIYDYGTDSLGDEMVKLYIDNNLTIEKSSDIVMNEEENHNMNLLVNDDYGQLLYRSLILASFQDEGEGSLIPELDYVNNEEEQIFNISFQEGFGSILKNKASNASNDFNILGNSEWVNIPHALENMHIDISSKNLAKINNGNTISLDGNNTYIEIPHNEDLLFEKNNFAIEFWMSFDNQSGKYPIFEKGKSIIADTTTDNSIFLYMDNADIKGVIGGKEFTKKAGTPLLSTDYEYHFVLQRDNSENDNISLWYYNPDSDNWEHYFTPDLIDSNLSNSENIYIAHSKNTIGLENFHKFSPGSFNGLRILKRAYTGEEFNDDLVPNDADDLNFTISTNTNFDNLINRFSFNDNKSLNLKNNVSQNIEGEINTDLIKFYNNGGAFMGSDYIEVSSTLSNINLNHNEFSIETWVELDSISKNNQVIIYKDGDRDGNGNGNENYILSYDVDNGFTFSVGNNIGIESVSSGVGNITTKIPYHIICEYREFDKIKIYINGIEKSAKDISTFSISTSQNEELYFGTDNTGNNGFVGKIYQVRFWQDVFSVIARGNHFSNPFEYSKELNPQDLLAEWLFEEEAGEVLTNTIDNDLNGTLNTSRLNFWGENKGSGYFDGINDYVSIRDDASYDFSDTEAFTLETWIKAMPVQRDENFSTILSKGNPYKDNNDTAGYLLGIDQETNKLKFKLSTDGGSAADSIELTSRTQFNDYDWHHLAIVSKAGEESPRNLYLYVDSILEDVIIRNNENLSNTSELLIGATTDSDDKITNNFYGYIDDLRMYNVPLNSDEIFAEYIEGANNLNSISYSILLKNNSDIEVSGDNFKVNALLPPFMNLVDNVDVFSAPNLKSDPQYSNDILTGLKYNFSYDFSENNFKPGEDIVLSFSVTLDNIYEKYSQENISDLKIVSDDTPIEESFFQSVTVLDNGFPESINGGNEISQGEQAPIQVRYISETTSEDLSKYSLINGEQKNSDLIFSTTGGTNAINPGLEHAPLSLEPPTINPESSDEYLRAYKRLEVHPDLNLDYLVPSNEFNDYFYSIPENSLRIQWKLEDDISSIDGFRWVLDRSEDTNTNLNDCSGNGYNCIGESVDLYNFVSSSEPDEARKWKLQNDGIEAATVYGGYGDFGESYYFTYLDPKQGKSAFKIKIRDSLGVWGDEREIPIWSDSNIPISNLSINGTNPKKENPASPTDWWREGVNNVFSVYDDVEDVLSSEEVSGIDFVDYQIYNAVTGTSSDEAWIRVNDNDAGNGGVLARWNFNEAGNNTLFDQKQNSNGTIYYNNDPDHFWTSNGWGDFKDRGASDGDYVSFGEDILDLTSDFAIEAWIKLDNINSSIKTLVSKWDDSSNDAYKVEIETNGSGGEISVHTSSGAIDQEIHTTNANLQEDTLYHLVISKGSEALSIYVNGVVKPTAGDGFTLNQNNSNTNFFIGKQNTSPPNFFDGKIDELRIYDRYLDSDEVSENFTSGGPNEIIYSHTDNNFEIEKIETEIDLEQDGVWVVAYKTQDKAMPSNETGFQSHTVKIDKTVPLSAAIESAKSNMIKGGSDWWKAYGSFGEGVLQISFEVQEGDYSLDGAPGSGIKSFHMVHVINEEPAIDFTIDWNGNSPSTTELADTYLGFTSSGSSTGSNNYESDNTIANASIPSCAEGIYEIQIKEDGQANYSIPVWIGGCDYNLLPTEVAKMVQNAINKYPSLTNYYRVIYNDTSEKFIIKSLGIKADINIGGNVNSELVYSNGKYEHLMILDENNGKTTQGSHAIYYWAEDNAGNIEEMRSKSFRIDTMLPQCPSVGNINFRPNAYAYRAFDGSDSNSSNFRDLSMINYVGKGYEASSIDTNPLNLMTNGFRQGELRPFFMWEKTYDNGNITGTEGINYSGNIGYAYLLELANDDDFNTNGSIKSTQPNNSGNSSISSTGWSDYKMIGIYDIDDDNQILNAHAGALMTSPISTSKDDIHDALEITEDNDGDAYFLWLRVKDMAGNENLCGQAGFEGNGPAFQYNYGANIKFKTQELDNASHVPLDISTDPDDPTVFFAKAKIAGDIINFNNLYYNYNNISTPYIEKTYNNRVLDDNLTLVKLLNDNGEPSYGENFSIYKDIVEDYPSVKITNSLNNYRPDMLVHDTDYFELSTDFEIIENASITGVNDFYTWIYDNNGDDTPQNIKSGGGLEAGKLQNFGIINGQREEASGNYNPLNSKVSLTWDGGGTGDWIFSEGGLRDHDEINNNLAISRGFTNVAGKYEVRVAIEFSENQTQYIQIEFDILPNKPSFDCGYGDCLDLQLKKP